MAWHAHKHGNHAAQATTIACMCMHMYIVFIAIFEHFISAMTQLSQILWPMDPPIQVDSDSDENFEELGDLVHQCLGTALYQQFKRLKAYQEKYRKLKEQNKECKRLVHHWKDQCLATKAQYTELDIEHQGLKVCMKGLAEELQEYKDEHDKIGRWLSQGSADHAQIKVEAKGGESQGGGLRFDEVSDEPNFKRSRQFRPQQPKHPPPAKLFPIGARLPKVLKPMIDEPSNYLTSHVETLKRRFEETPSQEARL